MRRLQILAVATLFLSIGCGGAGPMPRSKMTKDAAPEAAAARDAAGGKGDDLKEAKPRKVIFTANASLAVENFDDAETRIRKLVDEYKGYISKADINTSPNSRRYGTWTIRVPADKLEPFLTEVAKFGELHQRTLDSRDVTEEYYDLESRIKNKEAHQEALRELLKKKTDRTEDQVKVISELEKVTEDIDAARGRLRLMANQTEYATVVLRVQDLRDYVPPTSPAFGTTVSRAFGGSIEALVSFCKGIVIVLVVLLPWTPLMALVILPFYLLIRRALRSSAPRPPVPPTPPTVLPAEPLPPATA